MCERKFRPIKYTRRYSYAKFGTFFQATRNNVIISYYTEKCKKTESVVVKIYSENKSTTFFSGPNINLCKNISKVKSLTWSLDRL